MPELMGRVSVLDEQDNLVDHLESNAGICTMPGWPDVTPIELGKFGSPHAAAVDASGTYLLSNGEQVVGSSSSKNYIQRPLIHCEGLSSDAEGNPKRKIRFRKWFDSLLFRFFWRELQLFGARVYETEDFEAAITPTASGVLPLKGIVTAVQPLESLAQAMHQQESGGSVMKILMQCSES